MKMRIVLFVLIIGCLINSHSRTEDQTFTEFVWPMSGDEKQDEMNESWGVRSKLDNFQEQYDFHRGLDLYATFDDVHAIDSGRVYLIDNNFWSGDYMVVYHGRIYDTMGVGRHIHSAYVHLDTIYQSLASIVQRGEVIALSGDSGPRAHSCPPSLKLTEYRNNLGSIPLSRKSRKISSSFK